MEEFDARYPAYGFSRHKGYATSHHLAILARDGPCPIHRYSFRPVAQPVFSFAQRRSRGMNWDGAAKSLPPAFCKTRGYRILHRNYRPHGGGEVDLVCRQGDTLIFVEVKTRRSLAFGRPYEAVDLDKTTAHHAGSARLDAASRRREQRLPPFRHR